MFSGTRLVLFIALNVVAVSQSWHAFKAREAYGLFRFGAFEALILLLVRNVIYWFREPLSFFQIVSWVLLLGSLVLAIHGSYLLRVVGKANRRVVEDTETLVERGIYRYIRHPLYAALLFGGWGLFFKDADLIGGLLAVTATIFLTATARFEERHNIARFGDTYIHYMNRTRMFIPYVL